MLGLGRHFLPEDAQVGNDHVAILNYKFWREKFGGDPNIVGKKLRMSGELYTVVGVAAPGPSDNGDAEFTAIFSVVNAVLLQPLSYPNPDRLVALELSSPQGNSNVTSIPKFNVWREQTDVFDSVTAYDFSGPGINLTGGDRPELIKGIHVSADYFRVFGAPVALGRTFTPEEDRPGGPAVVVISNGLWRNRFGGDPGILNRTIDLGQEPYVIIGVIGPSYTGDPKNEIWLPLKPDPDSVDQGHYLRAAARLKPGVTLAQAQAAMKHAADEFNADSPTRPSWGPAPASPRYLCATA